ncbi:putative beta-defensin 109B [Neomonachus schauinslandi]|uniref:Beta-defensin 109B n=1 Tax=Neomonachus schauinslandi TaxID=29088 RepID=A0A8M1M8B0_NEOSC|nr:putative beta-defensin 109B [Neomonachus schauinslandi]
MAHYRFSMQHVEAFKESIYKTKEEIEDNLETEDSWGSWLLTLLLSPVRSGLASGENHCLNLSGICRRDICKLTEDQIGACKRRWRCCRSWWILIPIPTPLIYSDYQEPLKHKLK